MKIPLDTGAPASDGVLHISLSDEQLKGLAEQICSSMKPAIDCRTCSYFALESCSNTERCKDANLYNGLVALRLWATK